MRDVSASLPERTDAMTKRLLPLLMLGGLLAAPFLAPEASAQGATGAISRPGYSRGQAPTSDFTAQGTPMTRNQMVRQRAAAARGARQAAPARRAVRRRGAR